MPKKPGLYWSQSCQAFSARACLFHPKACGPLQLGSSAISNLDHFTVQVVHLWCFVLIKFNLQLTILPSYAETSTEGAQNGYHEMQCRLLIAASLTVLPFPIFQAFAVSADILALFADEEFPRYE